MVPRIDLTSQTRAVPTETSLISTYIGFSALFPGCRFQSCNPYQTSVPFLLPSPPLARKSTTGFNRGQLVICTLKRDSASATQGISMMTGLESGVTMWCVNGRVENNCRSQDRTAVDHEYYNNRNNRVYSASNNL